MKPGELLEILPKVQLICGEWEGRFPRSHSVLIQDTDSLLVDTGCGTAVLREYAAPGRVDLVVNSHTHPDHCAANHLFQDQTILVPKEGQDTAGRVALLSRRFAEPGDLALRWQEFAARNMDFEDRLPDGTFCGGQEIKVGSTRLVALHTPGHTKDHYVFHLPDHGSVISADIDLTPFGPWYGHRESSLKEWRQSIARVRALKPKVLISSHCEPVYEDIDYALAAYAAIIDQREAGLLKLLATERTQEDIVNAKLMYGRHPYYPELLSYWEWGAMKMHIEELIEKGNVARTETGFKAV